MKHRVLSALFAGLAALATAPAMALDQVKVGYLRVIPIVPYLHAQKMGYFKREGIDPELVTVNTGPAVVSAVVSGSVDIGFAASVPIILARARNQPIKVLASLDYEATPGPHWEWLIASEKSGIKSVKDLAGKKVAVNAAGSACELLVKEHLRAAGVPFESIKLLTVPFPQMNAALETGNADAACTVQPFYGVAQTNPKIKAVELASGALAGNVPRWIIDGYFAREDWLSRNQKAASAFARAIEAANEDLKKDPSKYRQYIMDEFKMPPELVSTIAVEKLVPTDVRARPEDWQPMIDAMARAGMIPSAIKATDMVLTLPN